MATGKALNGKPYAGNPHVRFDEGEVAPAATPRRGSLLYKRIAGFVGMALLVGGAQATDLTWTGAESATWNATALNWKDAGGTACAWTDGSTAVFPANGTVTNITVSGEVKPYWLMFGGGQWSFGGNATLRLTDGRMGQAGADPTVGVTFKDGLTVRVGTGVAGINVDMNLANLTIEHASILCPSNRFHNNWNSSPIAAQSQGIITIGAGGNLTANDLVLSPATSLADREKYAVNIYTNGVLNLLAGLHNQFTSKFGTLHSDGGEIQGGALMNVNAVTTTTKFSLGPGGVRFTSGTTQRINSPIEGEGPVVFDRATISYLRAYGTTAPTNSYTGGTHLLKSLILVINNDRNFGAVPAVTTNNVFVNASPTLLAEGGTAEFAPTRGFVLDANATMKIGGNGGGLIFRGPITGTNPGDAANGTISTETASWTPTHLAIEPAAGVTNRFGRLIVKGRDLIVAGEGVTEVNAKISAVENDNGILVINGVKLSVTNGLLTVANASYIGNRGHVVVSGGVANFSRIAGEFLNAFRLPGTTTVCRAGTMICNNFRMGEDQTSPEKALLRMGKGGTLLCSGFYQSVKTNTVGNVTDLTTSAQIDWDGGVIAARDSTSARNNFLGTTGKTGQIDAWIDRVKVYVREGGAVVSNNCEIRIRVPLQHGVAVGETDGGFTKWGTGMMAFVGTPDETIGAFNTFNGPINVEQGTLTMGSASNFLPTVALNVRSGATFNGNTMCQTFASLGGTGRVTNPSKLTVTDALAPGYGTNTIGTLTVAAALGEVRDGAELQIDLDAEGHSDCLSYAAALDLSKLRLVVNDLEKLNQDCKYVIATNLTSCTNDFASSNLPQGWYVKQTTSGGKVSLTLAFQKGTMVIFR